MGDKFNALMWSLLVEATDFVETGTQVGVTSGAVARDFDIPVWTCEINTGFLRRALDALSDTVYLCRVPSELFVPLVLPALGDRPLFYLDAHGWNGGLPLGAELAAISAGGKPAAVIVHDFVIEGFRCIEDYTFEYVTASLSPERAYRFYVPAYQPGHMAAGYLVLFQDVEPFGDLSNLVEIQP